MNCPSCQYSFMLGWNEYIKEPLGRHTCPQCGQRFKLEFSIKYILILSGASVLFVGIPSWLVLKYSNNLWITLAACVALGICVGLPVDKWLDNHMRLPVSLNSRVEK